MNTKSFLLLSCLFILPCLLIAQVPAILNYQGVLKNTDGTLVSDNTYFTIADPECRIRISEQPGMGITGLYSLFQLYSILLFPICHHP